MSSTGRSKNREEHKDDFYITPRWAIREFLREWNNDTGVPSLLAKNPAVQVLDPCAGGQPVSEVEASLCAVSGDPEAKWAEKVLNSYPFGIMPYEYVLREWGIRPFTLDIRNNSMADFKGDFLTYRFPSSQKFDLIMSNPPFSLIPEFVNRALNLLPDNAYLVYLLRLNYFGGQKRSEWLRTMMPERCYVHARRISFDPITRKTDSIEYMHAVWRKGYYPTATQLRVIPPGDDKEF